MTQKEKNFLTNLRYASVLDSGTEIKKALAEGISTNTCDDNGVCALSYAIHAPSPSWEVIDQLLQFDTNLEKADTNCLRMTPLMHALLTGKKNIVIGLLKRGADPTKTDVFGLAASDYLSLLLKDDQALSTFTKNYESLTSSIFISESIYEWLKPSNRQFPYSKYYENLEADSSVSCFICKHFRQHPNGELYIDVGIPGVYEWNRIVYQLFHEKSNEISDALSWRTYQQEFYAQCPICKNRYHYHRWWDEEFGSSMIEETLKRI